MSGIPCPHCGSHENAVVDSRPHDGTIRRRRKCAECKQRFTTHEMTGENILVLLKDIRKIQAVSVTRIDMRLEKVEQRAQALPILPQYQTNTEAAE